MLALSSFLSQVSGEGGVPVANVFGGIVKGIAQIAGTSLFIAISISSI